MRARIVIVVFFGACRLDHVANSQRLAGGAMTILDYVVVALLFALTCGAVLWAIKARECL
jgi:hypothetical protein